MRFIAAINGMLFWIVVAAIPTSFAAKAIVAAPFSSWILPAVSLVGVAAFLGFAFSWLEHRLIFIKALIYWILLWIGIVLGLKVGLYGLD